MPTIGDTTEGVWRKIIILPFDTNIQEYLKGKSDIDFEDKLINDEDVKSIIFNRMLEERKEIIKNGKIFESEKGKEVKQKHRERSQSVSYFLSEDVSKFDNTKNFKDFYTIYVNFALEEGFKPLGKVNFASEIERRKNDLKKYKSNVKDFKENTLKEIEKEISKLKKQFRSFEELTSKEWVDYMVKVKNEHKERNSKNVYNEALKTYDRQIEGYDKTIENIDDYVEAKQTDLDNNKLFLELLNDMSDKLKEVK